VQNYGISVVDSEGRVQSIQENPAPAEAKSNFASIGIYMFEPQDLDLMASGVDFDIGSELFPLLFGFAACIAWGSGRNAHARQGNRTKHMGRTQHLHRVGEFNYPGTAVYRVQREDRVRLYGYRADMDRSSKSPTQGGQGHS